ncbi:hypothetical protein BC831DRAFT_457038, partial [Entophlyctis helioformis]
MLRMSDTSRGNSRDSGGSRSSGSSSSSSGISHGAGALSSSMRPLLVKRSSTASIASTSSSHSRVSDASSGHLTRHAALTPIHHHINHHHNHQHHSQQQQHSSHPAWAATDEPSQSSSAVLAAWLASTPPAEQEELKRRLGVPLLARLDDLHAQLRLVQSISLDYARETETVVDPRSLAHFDASVVQQRVRALIQTVRERLAETKTTGSSGGTRSSSRASSSCVSRASFGSSADEAIAELRDALESECTDLAEQIDGLYITLDLERDVRDRYVCRCLRRATAVLTLVERLTGWLAAVRAAHESSGSIEARASSSSKNIADTIERDLVFHAQHQAAGGPSRPCHYQLHQHGDGRDAAQHGMAGLDSDDGEMLAMIESMRLLDQEMVMPSSGCASTCVAGDDPAANYTGDDDLADQSEDDDAAGMSCSQPQPPAATAAQDEDVQVHAPVVDSHPRVSVRRRHLVVRQATASGDRPPKPPSPSLPHQPPPPQQQPPPLRSTASSQPLTQLGQPPAIAPRRIRIRPAPQQHMPPSVPPPITPRLHN